MVCSCPPGMYLSDDERSCKGMYVSMTTDATGKRIKVGKKERINELSTPLLSTILVSTHVLAKKLFLSYAADARKKE